jgi:hypothetical protein
MGLASADILVGLLVASSLVSSDSTFDLSSSCMLPGKRLYVKNND